MNVFVRYLSGFGFVGPVRVAFDVQIHLLVQVFDLSFQLRTTLNLLNEFLLRFKCRVLKFSFISDDLVELFLHITELTTLVREKEVVSLAKGNVQVGSHALGLLFVVLGLVLLLLDTHLNFKVKIIERDSTKNIRY